MKPKTLLLMGAALAGGLWYMTSSGASAVKDAPDNLGMVIDNSLSQSLQCDPLPAMALDALSDMRVGKRSRLTVFTLGSPASSWEPFMALDMPAPRKGGSMFGGSFAANLKRVCAGFTQVNQSSIFRAVEVGLEHLRGEGCGQAGTHCKLLVESDGEENVSRGFYTPGAGGRAGKGTSLTNTGIKVLWCGYAITDSGGGPRGERVDALVARWRASFTSPGDVIFKPFCSSTSPAAQSSAAK